MKLKSSTWKRTSVRAYQAQQILDGAGFRNVKFMEGSLNAWPYDIYTANAGQ
jgi:rhodanese-related sulfurtransferase